MDPVPRRLESMKQLAFRVERLFAGRRDSELEQVAGPDELEKLIPDILVGPPHVADVEAPVRSLVSEHEGTWSRLLDRARDLVVSKPEGPEKSCASHHSRRSSDSR